MCYNECFWNVLNLSNKIERLLLTTTPHRHTPSPPNEKGKRKPGSTTRTQPFLLGWEAAGGEYLACCLG